MPWGGKGNGGAAKGGSDQLLLDACFPEIDHDIIALRFQKEELAFRYVQFNLASGIREADPLSLGLRSFGHRLTESVSLLLIAGGKAQVNEPKNDRVQDQTDRMTSGNWVSPIFQKASGKK